MNTTREQALGKLHLELRKGGDDLPPGIFQFRGMARMDRETLMTLCYW
jgi:hypothetical protein